MSALLENHPPLTLECGMAVACAPYLPVAVLQNLEIVLPNAGVLFICPALNISARLTIGGVFQVIQLPQVEYQCCRNDASPCYRGKTTPTKSMKVWTRLSVRDMCLPTYCIEIATWSKFKQRVIV